MDSESEIQALTAQIDSKQEELVQLQTRRDQLIQEKQQRAYRTEWMRISKEEKKTSPLFERKPFEESRGTHPLARAFHEYEQLTRDEVVRVIEFALTNDMVLPDPKGEELYFICHARDTGRMSFSAETVKRFNAFRRTVPYLEGGMSYGPHGRCTRFYIELKRSTMALHIYELEETLCNFVRDEKAPGRAAVIAALPEDVRREWLSSKKKESHMQ